MSLRSWAGGDGRYFSTVASSYGKRGVFRSSCLGHGIFAPRFAQASTRGVGCSGESYCCTGTLQRTSLLRYRSVGSRVVEYGFGIAMNNKDWGFFIYSCGFSIQVPAEVVSLLARG